MNGFESIARAFFLASLLLAVPALAQTQATRTWVSGVGDDANPCSRTAPCKTFAGAISKTAAGGEIDALDAGGFGAVTITKSITLDVRAVTGSILGADSNGIVVNITAPDDVAKAVRIRGLSINGVGNGIAGIKVVAANSVLVEDTAVAGFQDGVLVAAPGSHVMLRDCTFNGNRGTAVSVSAAGAEVTLSRTLVFDNATALDASGGGTIVSTGDNLLRGNRKDGAAPAHAPAQ